MTTKQELSKQACAKYAKLKGDDPQQAFRYWLARYVQEGHLVPDAEELALATARAATSTPGFVPVLAYVEPEPVKTERMKAERVRQWAEALQRHPRDPRAVGRSKLL